MNLTKRQLWDSSLKSNLLIRQRDYATVINLATAFVQWVRDYIAYDVLQEKPISAEAARAGSEALLMYCGRLSAFIPTFFRKTSQHLSLVSMMRGAG